MKISEIKSGMILSYIQMGLSVLINLIYTPFMIRMLGQQEYGLYNTAMSTISMLAILNLGFSNSYVKFFAIYKKNHDYESIYKLNGLFLLLFSGMGIVSMTLGLFISFNLDMIFANGLTVAEYQTSRVLMIILSFNMAFSFPMSVFSHIIIANEKFTYEKTISLIKAVCSPLLTIPFLVMGYGSIAMAWVLTLVSAATELMYVFYVFYKLKNKFIFHNFPKGLFKDLFSFTSFIAINIIIDQINWNVDKILLGRYRGTVSVAIYSVGYSLYSYYQMFSTSVSNVFIPRIHNIINNEKDRKNQRKKITEIFINVGRIQFAILSLISTGIFFFGKSFILNIWAGKGYDESYLVAVILVFSSTIALIQNIGIEVQRAINKHKFRSIVYLFMAMINLGLSIVLCQKYGAVGSTIGTAVSLVLANGLVMNIYYHKQCNINILKFWQEIGKMSRGLVLPAILGLILLKFTNQNNLLVWGIDIIAYTLIYGVSMWFIGLNNFEKNLIKRTINKIVKH